MPPCPRVLFAAGCLALLAGPAQGAPDAGYTVYAAGDIARCAYPDPAWSGAAATAAIVGQGLAANPNAAALTLGDNVYPRATLREYRDCYGPTWGRFRDRTYPAPGNREYATPGAAGYFGYFGKSAGPGYYSVQLGSWRLISLDSNLGPAAQAAQLAWLKDELERHPAHCRLAYWHHPLYSSGAHGSIARMHDAWQALYLAGADIVLSGHDHVYERFAPQDADGRLDPARGIRQFVVGTGGAFPTPFLLPQHNSEVRDNSRTGVLKLLLKDDGYEWEFLETSHDGVDGRAPDRGAARCHLTAAGH
jgi:3',5'-cyclic AMP phosphodiesterase CpdA